MVASAFRGGMKRWVDPDLPESDHSPSPRAWNSGGSPVKQCRAHVSIQSSIPLHATLTGNDVGFSCATVHAQHDPVNIETSATLAESLFLRLRAIPR